MTARVGRLSGERKYGSDDVPNPSHAQLARSLSQAMFGRGAAVSRITKWSERMLQHFMEPQSEKASPLDDVRMLLDGMRQVGVPGAAIRDVLDALCRMFGARCIPELPPMEIQELPASELLAELLEASAEQVAFGMKEFFDQDGISEEDQREFERRHDALVRANKRLLASVQRRAKKASAA